MITGCMPSSLWRKGSHVAEQPRFLAMRLGQSSTGSSGSKSVTFQGSWMAKGPAIVRDCSQTTLRSSTTHYAGVPVNMDCQGNGMTRRYPYSARKTGRLRLAFGNASACFAIWGFGFARLIRRWRMPISKNRENIKKLHHLWHVDRFEVWAMDEVRFEQHGSACWMWVPTEITDQVLLRYTIRKRIGYFGAIRIRDGRFFYCWEYECINRGTFFSFLKKLRRVSCHAGRNVVVIPDNVKYHNPSLHHQWREKVRGI